MKPMPQTFATRPLPSPITFPGMALSIWRHVHTGWRGRCAARDDAEAIDTEREGDASYDEGTRR